MNQEQIREELEALREQYRKSSARQKELMSLCGSIGHDPHVYLKSVCELGIDCAYCGESLTRVVSLHVGGWDQMTDEECIAEWKRDRD